MNLTYEEQQLAAIYDTGTRDGTISALMEMRGYLEDDENELRQLTDATVSQLEQMTDEQYASLDLIPDGV